MSMIINMHLIHQQARESGHILHSVVLSPLYAAQQTSVYADKCTLKPCYRKTWLAHEIKAQHDYKDTIIEFGASGGLC